MKSQDSKRYWRNSLSLLAGNLGIATVTLLATPELLTQLGSDRYGLFRIGMIAFVGYMAQLRMGLGVAGRRFFADAYHDFGHQKANYVLGQLFICFFTLAVIAMFIAMGAAAWLGDWIQLGPGRPLASEPHLFAEFQFLLLGAGVWVAGLLLRLPMIGAMEALGRFDLQQLINASTRILLYGGIIIGTRLWGASLTMVAAFAGCLSVAEWVFARCLIPFAYPEYRPKFGIPDKVLLSRMLRFSYYGALSGLGGVFVYSFPEILIAVTPSLGAQEVTHFGLALLVATQIRALLTAFSASLFPSASKYRSDGDQAALQNLLFQSITRNVCIWGSVAIPLAFFGADFFEHWVGVEFRPLGILVVILSLDSLGAAVGLGANYILIAAGSIRLVGLSQLFASSVAAIAMLVSINFTSLGLPGLALALGLTQVARGAFALPYYACSQLEYSTLAMWRNIGPRLMAFLILSAAIVLGVDSTWSASSFMEVLAQLVFAGGACVLLGLLIFARKEVVVFLANHGSQRNMEP